MQENLKRQLFRLPPRSRDLVRQITPGLPLFLYNYSTHQLHGIFEVGTAVVTRSDGRLALGRLGALCEQIKDLNSRGFEVILVASGAVGVGRQRLRYRRLVNSSFNDLQKPQNELDGKACAAVGQSGLMALYDALFSQLDVTSSQLLVTDNDFRDPNFRQQLSETLNVLLRLRVIPIFNENDAISTRKAPYELEKVVGESYAEEALLKDTAAYYSRKASNWILEDSCPDYMLKAEECLKREKDRVAHYLHSSSEQKLLEKVQHELLYIYASQLLEKEHSGCHALLRDDKVEDLSRMFRLFSKIPRGLDPVSSIFKQVMREPKNALGTVNNTRRCSV